MSLAANSLISTPYRAVWFYSVNARNNYSSLLFLRALKRAHESGSTSANDLHLAVQEALKSPSNLTNKNDTFQSWIGKTSEATFDLLGLLTKSPIGAAGVIITKALTLSLREHLIDHYKNASSGTNARPVQQVGAAYALNAATVKTYIDDITSYSEQHPEFGSVVDHLNLGASLVNSYIGEDPASVMEKNPNVFSEAHLGKTVIAILKEIAKLKTSGDGTQSKLDAISVQLRLLSEQVSVPFNAKAESQNPIAALYAQADALAQDRKTRERTVSHARRIDEYTLYISEIEAAGYIFSQLISLHDPRAGAAVHSVMSAVANAVRATAAFTLGATTATGVATIGVMSVAGAWIGVAVAIASLVNLDDSAMTADQLILNALAELRQQIASMAEHFDRRLNHIEDVVHDNFHAVGLALNGIMLDNATVKVLADMSLDEIVDLKRLVVMHIDEAARRFDEIKGSIVFLLDSLLTQDHLDYLTRKSLAPPGLSFEEFNTAASRFLNIATNIASGVSGTIPGGELKSLTISALADVLKLDGLPISTRTRLQKRLAGVIDPSLWIRGSSLYLELLHQYPHFVGLAEGGNGALTRKVDADIEFLLAAGTALSEALSSLFRDEMGNLDFSLFDTIIHNLREGHLRINTRVAEIIATVSTAYYGGINPWAAKPLLDSKGLAEVTLAITNQLTASHAGTPLSEVAKILPKDLIRHFSSIGQSILHSRRSGSIVAEMRVKWLPLSQSVKPTTTGGFVDTPTLKYDARSLAFLGSWCSLGSMVELSLRTKENDPVNISSTYVAETRRELAQVVGPVPSVVDILESTVNANARFLAVVKQSDVPDDKLGPAATFFKAAAALKVLPNAHSIRIDGNRLALIEGGRIYPIESPPGFNVKSTNSDHGQFGPQYYPDMSAAEGVNRIVAHWWRAACVDEKPPELTSLRFHEVDLTDAEQKSYWGQLKREILPRLQQAIVLDAVILAEIKRIDQLKEIARTTLALGGRSVESTIREEEFERKKVIGTKTVIEYVPFKTWAIIQSEPMDAVEFQKRRKKDCHVQSLPSGMKYESCRIEREENIVVSERAYRTSYLLDELSQLYGSGLAGC